jgi:hypothetical protein
MVLAVLVSRATHAKCDNNTKSVHKKDRKVKIG